MTRPPKSPASTAPAGDRIAKVLSRSGIASRREAERMIAAGEVAVNGKVIDSPALNVSAKDRITVNGQPLAPPEPPRLWLYYKPEGLVTSAADEKGRDTVFDHLPEDMPRVMSIGRLDLNSEGLLLLTNDGELKRRLELPSTGWLRKYRVRVKGNPTEPDLEPLRQGITVEGERFQPMQVTLDRHQGANAWLTVGLREGRNREIRRAMAAIGLTVNRLIRVSYGPFRLNEMQPGEVEEVRPRVLRDQLGLTQPAGEEAPGKRPARPAPARPAKAPERPPRTATAAGGAQGARDARTHATARHRAGASAPSARGPAAPGRDAKDGTFAKAPGTRPSAVRSASAGPSAAKAATRPARPASPDAAPQKPGRNAGKSQRPATSSGTPGASPKSRKPSPSSPPPRGAKAAPAPSSRPAGGTAPAPRRGQPGKPPSKPSPRRG